MKMPIPSDWTGEYCIFAICWPDSQDYRAILRGQLTAPGRGFFWDERTGTVTEAQSIIKATFDYNIPLWGCIMSCADNGALYEIASALRLLAQNQCCGDAPPANGGVQVVVNTPGGSTVPLYGSQQPIELPPGQVPPNYDGDLAEYLADKCRVAAAMVDGWVATLRNLATLDFAQTNGLLVLVIAAVAGFVLLPEFLVPTLIAAAIVLVLVRHLIVELADAMAENKEEIVCFMIENDSAETILAAVSDLLDVLIAGITTSNIYGAALKTIALVLVNTDTLNQLFNMSQGAGSDYPCPECGPCLFRYEFDTDLEDITPRAGFIAPEWSSSGGGSASFPGLGGGGPNWSGGQLTGAQIAAATGADISTVTSQNITVRFFARGLTDSFTCQGVITLYDNTNTYQGHSASNIFPVAGAEVEYTFPGGTVHDIGYLEILGGDNVATPAGTPCGVFIDWLEIEIAC